MVLLIRLSSEFQTTKKVEYKTKDLSADAGLRIDEIINKHKIVDWQRKDDIKNNMRQEIEDYLFSIKGRYDLNLKYDEMDEIIEQSIEIACRRY